MTQIIIDEAIILRDGPFCEFKQDVSIVAVELVSGKVYSNILILYPSRIIGMKDHMALPFEVKDNINGRADKSWLFF